MHARACSTGAEGAAAEGLVALRLCTELRAPGCLHAVLESVAPRAPYLLENRSGHPLRYRQACKPRGVLRDRPSGN